MASYRTVNVIYCFDEYDYSAFGYSRNIDEILLISDEGEEEGYISLKAIKKRLNNKSSTCVKLHYNNDYFLCTIEIKGGQVQEAYHLDSLDSDSEYEVLKELLYSFILNRRQIYIGQDIWGVGEVGEDVNFTLGIGTNFTTKREIIGFNKKRLNLNLKESYKYMITFSNGKIVFLDSDETALYLSNLGSISL